MGIALGTILGKSWACLIRQAEGRVISVYCTANWASTSLHAGEIEPARVARHCMIRPPPGATPPHSSVRTSPLHADLRTNNSSRRRIGRTP